MKLQFLSDLHLEFDRTAGRSEMSRFDEIPDAGADVIVLAGDIDTGLAGPRWAVAQSERLGKPILYVFGNHEYYGHAIPRLLDKGRQLVAGTGVSLLERDEIVVGSVRFLGCTLWTDYALLGDAPQAMQDATAMMTEFRRVRVSPQYRRLAPRDLLFRHRESTAWLRQRLSEPWAGSTVVVTHHAPSGCSLPAAFRGDTLSPAYASDLESLMGPAISLWLHGHVHRVCDYAVNGTRILCNARGYYPFDLVEGFESGKRIDVEQPF
jgi:predicted phosphodiesterase